MLHIKFVILSLRRFKDILVYMEKFMGLSACDLLIFSNIGRFLIENSGYCSFCLKKSNFTF